MKPLKIIILIIVLNCSSPAYSQTTYIDSLQQIIALNKHDDAERRSLSLLAVRIFRTDPAKAKILMWQLVKLTSDAEDYKRQSAAYNLLLAIYQDEGKVDSALYCVNMLRKVMERAPGNYQVLGNVNQAIGLYYEKTGDFKTALPYSLDAVKFAELGSPDDKAYIGGQWLNAGNVYYGLGDYKKAMACNLKALALFETAGNKRGEAFCYTNLSGLYINLKQYNNALKAAQQSLQLKTSLNDNRGSCTSMEAIGKAYMSMQKLPEAFSNYESALKIAIAEKLPLEEATCYFNMAKIFAQQGKDSLAIIYFKKTKLIAIELNNKLVAANTDLELAALYKNAKDLKNTENILVTSLQTFKEAGSLEKESDNYKRLADFYAGNSQYDKALFYTNKYHDIKDSISGSDIQVQVKKLEEQYNSVKKENEIALLKKDKELQQQKLSRQRILFAAAAVLLVFALIGIALFINRSRLRQRMKELELRNRIAADLHDEVGSSLSSIHMLSQMAQDDETTHKDILARMSSNAKETMDKMGDIIWMIKPGEAEAASLNQRMERFAHEICSSKNIGLSLDLVAIETIKLSMERRKNIYLIFKEAMNNAVKYSGTQSIDIKAILQNRQLELSIKDHGKGFETALTGRGNGLDNMKNRATESGGMLSIDSSFTGGTTVTLLMQV